MKREVPCLFIITAAILALLVDAPPMLAAPRLISAANKPVAQAAAVKVSPIQAGAQRLMVNIQNWLMEKASALIGNTQTAVKNEIKRRLDRQIKNIEAPINGAVKTIKEVIAIKYNSMFFALENIYKKALPRFDK